MKRIELIFTLVSVLFSANIYAISNYEPGDSLYVWASKGLQLRVEPNFSSEAISLMEFGELVIAIEKKPFYPDEYRPDEVSVIEIQSKKINNRYYPNFRLSGKWCKVNYKGKEGYVFDAYLSSLKVIDYGESPKKYFDRNFLLIDTIFYQENMDGQERRITKLIYKSGIVYYSVRGVSYGSETIVFPFSFEESYLFFISRYINNDDPYLALIESDKDKTTFAGPMEEITLTKLNGFVIIENGWGN
jgi:hypothetical protein